MNSLYRRHIQHAMPECPECHTRVTNVRVVAEHYFENSNVTDDRGRDGGDEEKDRGDEQKSYTNPVARSATDRRNCGVAEQKIREQQAYQ